MEKQLIIAIGREFGSGGHEIARRLAKHYGLLLLDKQSLSAEMKKENLLDIEVSLTSASAAFSPMYSNTPTFANLALQQALFEQEFAFIRDKADKGSSFVVVGRCADDILSDNPNCVRIFVLADQEFKLGRVMQAYSLNDRAAANRMRYEDKTRKTYHNYFCKYKWGDSRGYDLCINSGKLGLDKTVSVLIHYIDTNRA